MNIRIHFKKIVDQCKKGEFKEILEMIHEHDNWKDSLNHSSGIKLMASCCNACVQSPKYISDEHLLKFLQIIVPTIENPNESDLLIYIQSIYHISDMLVRKNSYNIITEMEGILIPQFLPSTLPKKHRETYSLIVVILYNVVANSARENNYNESLIRISLLMAKICSKTSDPVDLFNKSYKCFMNLIYLKVTVEEQKHFFKDILLLVDGNRISAKSEDCFMPILRLSSIILRNILQTFDFKQALEYLDNVSNLAEKKLIHEEYIHLFRLLKSSLIISPVETKDTFQDISKCSESLRILDRIWEEFPNNQEIRDKLIVLIQTVTYYYKSRPQNEWADTSELLQLEILHFIAKITSQSFSHIQIILSLIEMYVKHESSSTVDYHRECLQILKTFFDHIKHLKEQECEEWHKAWNTLGIGVYNIGVNLNRSANKGTMLYFKFLLKSYIKLESENGVAVLKQPTISNCLRLVCNLHLNEPKKYLEFTSLAMVLCPNNRETFINGWIKMKHSQREDTISGTEDIQKITILTALQLLQEDAPELVMKLNDSDKLCLLKFELEQYKRKWKSKIPTTAVVQQLCELPDLNGVVEVLVDIFCDNLLPIHDDCLEAFSNILCKFSSKHDGTTASKIRLAVLYHIYYKYSIRQIIIKNALDMERTCVDPIKLPSGLIPRDPKDECDVASSCESLTLEKYLLNLKNLDKALSVLSKITDELNAKDNVACAAILKLYDRLIQISYEYRLLRNRVRCLQATELALKVAQIENNSNAIVQASSFLIEFADIRKKYPQRQIKIVDSMLENNEILKTLNTKTVILYYICKSKSMFNINFRESFNAFKKGKALMDSQEDEEGFSAIKSQLFLLKFKFASLPCELEIENHKENTLMDVYSATAVMFKEYRNNRYDNMEMKDREYEISVLLDASEELTRIYHFMKVPMEVRRYGKETCLLTQKLVLPLRYASFILYLAHADLMTNRLEGCQVKLNDMAKILTLHKSMESKILRNPQKCSSPKVAENGNDSMEMVLDWPAESQYMREFSQSSPKFIVNGFRLPPISEHEKFCQCFYCISFEYHFVVLEQTRLSALLNVKRNDVSVAQTFFEGALKMYDCFNDKWRRNKEKLITLIHRDLVPEFSREIILSYGYTLLNYSSHLRRTGNKTDALDVNSKLISALAAVKLEHVYLYNEAIVQKLGYLTESLTIDPLPEIQNDMETLTVNDRDDMPKTPESKQSQIFFPVKPVTPYFSPHKPTINKCILFNLSPEEAVEKKPVRKTILKTPAPKIQIYTDTSERKTKQNKCQESNNLMAGTSGDIATPISTEIKSGLKTRTRLLTEKLRQTSKKNEASSSQAEAKRSTKVPSSSKRLPAKKNLMMELAGTENEQSNALKGAIRKSARNK